MEFGEKVQLLRKESGMSQEKLAERLNVSRQEISQWIEMEVYGSCYTNPMYYLKEMPVILIAAVGAVCFIMGLADCIKEKSKNNLPGNK